MPEKKNKHMDIHDRLRTQEGIESRESFASIAREIGVSTSTVSREVKNNRKRSVPKGKRCDAAARSFKSIFQTACASLAAGPSRVAAHCKR